jgi:hypothetical protein
MTTYLATYGNGTKRLFDCFTVAEANANANAYGKRHHCGILCSVTIYKKG